MASSNPETFFASTTNSFIIPDADTDIHKLIARWSDERLGRPAIIVTPSSQDDIIAAIRYARENSLTLVAGSGGHKVVPVGEKTLYLDMRKFKGIKVDKDNETVEIGGAVTNSELMSALLQDGYYTRTPTTFTTFSFRQLIKITSICELGGGFNDRLNPWWWVLRCLIFHQRPSYRQCCCI